jgi:DNA mismatch endonuclease (patch repair protein)
MDIWTNTKRSSVMGRIRSKNTRPEMVLRSNLHRLGYRYRIHDVLLPGKPDIVFKSLGVVIFVHGCFWHQHKNCIDGRIPKSNSIYWRNKLRGNMQRDKRHKKKLNSRGFKVLTIWECQIERNLQRILKTVCKKLDVHTHLLVK